MKKFAKIASVALSILILVSALSVSTFAAGIAFDNDLFYLELPLDYILDGEHQDIYCSKEDELRTLYIHIEENYDQTAIKSTPDSEVIDIYADIVLEDEEDFVDTKLVKAVFNGLNAAVITYNNEFAGALDNCAFMFSNADFIFVFEYCNFGDEYTEAQLNEINESMKTFLMNGEYLDGDSLSVAHDFDSAEVFNFEEFFGYPLPDYGFGDEFDPDYYDYDTEGVGVGVVIISCVIAFPTVVLLIVAIVLMVKYSKKKKKLKEYHSVYGAEPIYTNAPVNTQYGYQNNGAPNQYGYQNNAYSPAPTYPQAQSSGVNYTAPQQPQAPVANAQPPVQEAKSEPKFVNIVENGEPTDLGEQ